MADNLCGPSNALQSFQKHTTVDRTLQQDRLVTRQSQPQGFRSSVGPNSGLLDREFEAFQAGNPLEHGFEQQPFSQLPPGLQQPGPPNWATEFQQFQQPGPSNWASDFQRLNISNHPPQFNQTPFNGAQAQQRQDTGGWHQDFALQQSQIGDWNVQKSQSVFNYHNTFMGGMGSRFMASPQIQNPMWQSKQPVEQFDDEAFARAFDEAAKSQIEEIETIQEPAKERTMDLGQEIMINESAEIFMSSDPDSIIEVESSLAQQERIGSDTIYDPKDPQNIPDDPDKLSRTAGQLLRSVRHEQNDKFKKSAFLELMRQFRDREKTVEGDKVVSVND